MAKQRFINTKFWSDEFIQELDIDTRYLYLYLLTNEHTNICGIYEISDKTIIFETNLTKDRLSKSIDRLSKNNKVYRIDGWIFIKNFKKYQLSNPKVQKGIKIEESKVPEKIWLKIKEYDRLSIDYDRQPHPNPNPNSNLKEIYKENFSPIEKEKKDIPPDLTEIVNSWNTIETKNKVKNETILPNKPIMKKCTKITDDILKTYKKLKYTKDEIIQAIKNYAEEICKRDNANSYNAHRFYFNEFLKQSNGVHKFITQ